LPDLTSARRLDNSDEHRAAGVSNHVGPYCHLWRGIRQVFIFSLGGHSPSLNRDAPSLSRRCTDESRPRRPPQNWVTTWGHLALRVTEHLDRLGRRSSGGPFGSAKRLPRSGGMRLRQRRTARSLRRISEPPGRRRPVVLTALVGGTRESPRGRVEMPNRPGPRVQFRPTAGQEPGEAWSQSTMGGRSGVVGGC
jgi:hypothetical protein